MRVGRSRDDWSAVASRGGVRAGPSGSSFGAVPLNGGMGAGLSRAGAAAGQCISNASSELQAPVHVGFGILRSAVKQRTRRRGSG